MTPEETTAALVALNSDIRRVDRRIDTQADRIANLEEATAKRGVPTWLKIVVGLALLGMILIALTACHREQPDPDPSLSLNRRVLEDVTGGTHQKREDQMTNLYRQGVVLQWELLSQDPVAGVLVVDGSRWAEFNEAERRHVARLYFGE